MSSLVGAGGAQRTPRHIDALRVDGRRLLSELDMFSRIGADENGGMSRLGFGHADNTARLRLRELASAAGLSSSVDQAGNVFVHSESLSKLPPADAVTMIGSHLDTVRRGGHLDGVYGVLAGLEVLRTVEANHVPLMRELVVVAFANEEGALFPQPFWGSKAIAGELADASSAIDRSGNSIRGTLRAAGGDLAAIAEAEWPADAISEYLELHIEQGPVLADANAVIGVVSSVVGRTILNVTVVGAQNHAGTTPMDVRHDALTAAAQMVLEIERVSVDRDLCRVSTVGVLTVEPGQTNVIPGAVEFTAEVRDADEACLKEAEQAVLSMMDEVARNKGVHIEVEVTMRTVPVRTAGHLQGIIAASADRLGLASMVLPSGAGHDAQIVGSLAPIGMIFVPSRGGISHAPEEHTEPDHLVHGANVLLHSVLSL